MKLSSKRFSSEPRGSRARRRPFTWRMFLLILGVLVVLSSANVLALEMALKMEIFPLLASMGVGTYWMLMALVAALIIHQVSCVKFDRPMRRLSQAMRQVAQGDFSARVQPMQKKPKKTDYMDLMFEDFNRMVQELASIETLKDDFIANVSHEIKTPLAIISSYAKALETEDLDEAVRREYAGTIANASRNLNTLIGNILKLNKLENQEILPSVRQFDLTEQLSECILSRENKWEEKHILMDVQLEERIFVVADESMLEIVWGNLLDNAIKFTPEGGKILVRQDREGDRVAVSVSDTGCGMDEETRRHIFEKFYQGDTSRSGEGNGLGLALVRRVLEISKGTIEVESSPGQGAEFTVRLNCLPEEV